MIDPLSLSVAALLARALGGAAEEVGRGATDTLGRLVVAVRKRFAGDERAVQALAAVERSPADGARSEALAVAIAAHMSADPAFHDEVEELVAEAKRDPQINQFVTEVRDNAQVGKIVNIGQAGDVNL